ncbi:hypothetical protein HYPDE_26358 [Hyphomicrobium denitrificans 1NES1]|uniref:HTH crp-type domain-containing protein n=1 Tax=Hyphomicrobium denitrificans 1NES1 TaxID=670307 RepID=N0B0J2_9HYPH|nr:hypothetical protein [Hyphomicrobium denitrificans]AGK56954.1 hypothetical protein HYPDE_26358 [Hyphomicrobium denitrificans 1NES1]
MAFNRVNLGSQAQRIEEGRQAAQQKRKRLQTEEARYTLILHSARKKLGISIHEYCLADSVHKLSSTHSPVPGWCFASKEQLGQSLGFSRQSIHGMIKRLREVGLVELQPETGYLRSTQKWRDTVEVTKALVFGD